MYSYELYGLAVESSLPLPELIPASFTSPDVIIREAKTPTSLENASGRGALYEINRRQMLMKLDNVANYLVSDGREIIIERLPAVDDATTRLFLFTSAMGALLHQRGMLPLHASSIETPYGAVLFTGQSGIGKSTTAALFRQRGYTILADDVTVISLIDGKPMAVPGFPQMKLWEDSLVKLGEEAQSLKRIRPEIEKYVVPIREGFRTSPVPIHAIYALRKNSKDELALIPLHGLKKVNVLKNNIYRLRFMEQMGVVSSSLLMLAQDIRLSAVRRPERTYRVDELIELLEKDFSL